MTNSLPCLYCYITILHPIASIIISADIFRKYLQSSLILRDVVTVLAYTRSFKRETKLPSGKAVGM